MTERRPLLLLTNDDGVQASGLRVLRQAALAMGDRVIVAPTREQRTQSHAITLDRPLRHTEHKRDVHWIDGKPADCVYSVLFEARFFSEHNLITSVFRSSGPRSIAVYLSDTTGTRSTNADRWDRCRRGKCTAV